MIKQMIPEAGYVVCDFKSREFLADQAHRIAFTKRASWARRFYTEMLARREADRLNATLKDRDLGPLSIMGAGAMEQVRIRDAREAGYGSDR